MCVSSKWVAGLAAIALALATGLVAGCGGGSDEPVELKIGMSEEGKATSFSAPKSVDGGLVEVKFTNEGKVPHGVQFVRYTGNHTAEEALKEVASESEETPEWLRAEGGIGPVPGGETANATLNLEEGNFLLVDSNFFEGGKPATAEMKVGEGDSGDLPESGGTVVAEEEGKDKYAWNISGLKTGKNDVTFESQGDKAIHVIIAVPLKGKVPPLSQIKTDIGKNGPPPKYVEFEGVQSTAILDGGKSQTTELELKKPGKYLFFCPLTDRDGGKQHDQEGLLAVENVE